MSANPDVTPIGKAPSLKPGQALVVGRVMEVRRTEKATFTIVASAAPDAYSHPGQHEITSQRLIGKPGEDVQVKVQLGGFKRSYQTKGGDNVTTVDNYLKAIED